MSALVRFLYPLAARSRSPAAIIGWWERRRLAFNLAVGATGLVSLGMLNLAAALPPLGHSPSMPLMFPVVYAVLANIFYTAGWVGELGFYAWWRKDPPDIGPVLFRQGLIFSVGLTLLPIVVAGWDWTVRLARWVLSL